MGILKDHISLISFLKPGIIKVYSKDSEENFYVDDGIVEFKDNSLSILTSSIFNVKDKDKKFIDLSISEAEKELSKEDKIQVKVRKAQGQKCERCWKILEKKCQRESCPII